MRGAHLGTTGTEIALAGMHGRCEVEGIVSQVVSRPVGNI